MRQATTAGYHPRMREPGPVHTTIVAACLAACAGAAHGTQEATPLPGARPGWSGERHAPAEPAVASTVVDPRGRSDPGRAAQLWIRAVRPGDADAGLAAVTAPGAARDPTPGAVPARSCEAALRLPWGPIESCRTAIVAGAVGSGAAVSALAWWSQGFGSRFNVASEDWFGRDTYAGGVDKLGHAYSFYLATRLGTRALTWAQVPDEDALALAAGVSLGFGLGVEVLDGLSRSGRHGFSWEDLAMNFAGVGFAALMESHPDLDRYLAFRWMYSPAGRKGSWYDHHTYLLAFRLSGLSAVGHGNPLRYLELVAGYGAKGFRSDFDYGPEDLRRRTVYLGISLDLTELLDRTLFSGSARNGSAHRWTTETLRYLQPPGAALAWRRTWRP